MKLILSLITITLTGSLFAQTKQITKYDDVLSLKERYDVLESDTNIRQGEYALISSKLLRKGFYKNNQKDSVWTSYDYNRDIQIVYDYTHKKLIDYKKSRWDNSKNGEYDIINGTDTTKRKLDQPPIYLDGDGKRLAIVIIKTRYPAEAREKNIQGKVIIAFTIDENGDVSKYKINKRIGGGCDEEALRIAKLITGEWLPGMLNGKPVKVEYEMPFSFTLQTEDR
ncbi:energy transducer TonB [Mucilaginibacter sp. BT774]|uniref:energy transducer TonB n=1 Tax=Mucilaginibacter sp. BT774 TaxID=3062276 RepID=UPI0026754825|nr:energy transducer TonB [Mucilaginibacter sp. BT774]MDO3626677.1 energy transducer TonB [Mucilaginibacter sp. BT774]